MNRPDPGYSIHEGVFDRAAMLEVLEALDGAELTRTRAGARHVLTVSAVRALASEPALVRIASQYLGMNAFPFRATLFDKSAVSNWLVAWHQDTALPIRRQTDVPGWGPWSQKGGVLHAIAPAGALGQVIALRVHLDDSTSENGPLRVLPDTHALGVLSHQRIKTLAAAVTPVDCLVAMGSVVAMRPLTVHASSKARADQPRRVVHVEYAATVHLEPGIELAVGEQPFTADGCLDVAPTFDWVRVGSSSYSTCISRRRPDPK